MQRKKLKPTDHWTDLWHGEHARYFTVARSTYADIINDVYDEVVKAIADGSTLKTFQDRLTPILQEKGWWGKAEDGVQLGSPRRLRTIYDTNLRTSYAAGRWERIQRRKNPGRICVMFAFWMKRPERHTGSGTVWFCRLIIPFGRHIIRRTAGIAAAACSS